MRDLATVRRVVPFMSEFINASNSVYRFLEAAMLKAQEAHCVMESRMRGCQDKCRKVVSMEQEAGKVCAEVNEKLIALNEERRKASPPLVATRG